MKTLMPILIVFCLFSLANSQKTELLDNRKERPFGINLYILGPDIVGSLSVDYFLFPFINIEAGTGLFGYYYGGNIHFFKKQDNQQTTFYVGLYNTTIREKEFGIIKILKDDYLYIPIGFHNAPKSGVFYSVEAAPCLSSRKTKIWAGIKVGYHF